LKGVLTKIFYFDCFYLFIDLGVELGTVSSDTSVKIGFLFLSAGDFIGLANVIDTTA
jgi:hypothetical protein